VFAEESAAKRPVNSVAIVASHRKEVPVGWQLPTGSQHGGGVVTFLTPVSALERGRQHSRICEPY